MKSYGRRKLRLSTRTVGLRHPAHTVRIKLTWNCVHRDGTRSSSCDWESSWDLMQMASGITPCFSHLGPRATDCAGDRHFFMCASVPQAGEIRLRWVTPTTSGRIWQVSICISHGGECEAALPVHAQVADGLMDISHTAVFLCSHVRDSCTATFGMERTSLYAS